MSFRVKTILGIAAIEAVLLAILITTTLGYLHDTNERQLVKRANTTAALIATMAQDSVISSDLASLESLVKQSLHNRELSFVRVLGVGGRVLVARGDRNQLAQPFAVNHGVDHLNDGIFHASAPIEVAGIHYGQVQIGVDAHSLMVARGEARHRSLMIAAVEMGLVALFSFFLGLYLTRQLGALTRGAHQIAEGNLGYLVPVKGNDELAKTATAFNRMSRQVAENVARRDAVMQSALDGILTADEQGRVVEFNPAAEAMLGFQRDEIIGKSLINKLIPERLRDLYREGFREHSQTGEFSLARQRFETYVCRADGEEIPAEVAIAVTKVGGGSLFTVFLRDISERRNTEQRLRLLSRAVEQSPASVVMTDLDGNIEFVNAKFVEISGYGVDEVIGQNPRLLKSGLTPPERYEEMWSALTRGREWRGELINRKKTGETYWEWVSISPMRDASGQVRHYLGVKEDISDRKHMEEVLRQSEARFRSFFEQNSSVMLLVDPDTGTIVSANEAAARYYGYPLVYLTGMSITKINILTEEKIAEKRRQAVEQQQSHFYFQHRLASGELRDVEVFSTPLVSNGRNLLFSIVHDVTERYRAEMALRETESRLRIFIERFPGAVLVESAEHNIVLANRHFCELFDISASPERLVGADHRHYIEHVKERIAEPGVFMTRLEELVQQRRPAFEEEVVFADGHIFERDYVPIHSGDRFMGHIWLYRDVTLQKLAEEKLKLAASVFAHAREGIIITDADGSIIEVNKTFSQITGYGREEVMGRNPRLLHSGEQGAEFYTKMWNKLSEKGYWHGEIWDKRKNGENFAALLTVSAVRDTRDRVRQYVALFTDITEQKIRHQKQLERATHYDALTGLINRVSLGERLQRLLHDNRDGSQGFAVVFIDFDDFGALNDSQGQEIGDQFLLVTADRLRAILDEGDLLARLSGDEFVLVLKNCTRENGCDNRLSEILSEITTPAEVAGSMLTVTASAGVTFFPQPERIDADQLLRQADQAMYQAKVAGKNRYHVFDPEHDRTVRGHYESMECIRRSLGEGDFELYYQPKVNMRSGEVVGVEALIRWHHPEHGLLLPAAFLPVIAETPLEVELGDWVLDAALAQMERWQAAGHEIAVSVNVSGRQLQQPDFLSKLRRALARHPSVKAETLELEVLESGAMEDIMLASRVIEDCRALGVGFALDDFGTGYSSLTYLRHLSASTLKIDQSFVRDMLEDPGDLAIVEGVLGLAIAFRRQVIAEGVETAAHGEMMLKLGCELGQGYGIARPMPAGEIPGWIAEWRPEPSWSQQRAVERHELSALYAVVEHNAWILSIEKYLRGEREKLPSLGIRECRFGKWLNGDGARHFSGQPRFESIKPLHEQVHELAKELLALKSVHRDQDALDRLPELFDLRDRMFTKLEELLQAG